MEVGTLRHLASVVCLLVLTGLVSSAVRADDSFVPEWSKKAVWYQIFPERFRNGDPSNDPRLVDQDGSWPHSQAEPWQVHPWTSDWYRMQPYEKAHAGKDIWFHLQRRRYGGDLQGVIDKLDYLRDLGINAVYLNPVFMAPSSHKYDAYVYQHIDPTFGPDPEGDRRLIASEKPDDPSTWHWTAADKLALELIRQAHLRGIRVVFDGVFNHMGMTNPFFTDVVKNQQASPYRDWFEIKSWADPATGKKFEYQGWFGVKELPNLRQDEKGIVTGPREYILAITRRWMDPSGQGRPQEGIDGWRLDVAFCVKHAFWKDWSRLVRSINPEAYMTAEVIDTVEANKPYLEGDEFSAVMNYNFAFTCHDFFFARRHAIRASKFDSRLREIREAYAPQVAYGMQNLLGSHDTARVASNVVNADLVAMRDWHAYCEKAKGSNPEYLTRKPTPEERQRQKLAVLFQMTYVGAPMIYYGDEVGMWGGNDPCCRKPMVWDDLKYEAEATLPDQKPAARPDPVEVDRDLLEHYRRCIALRKTRPALQVGDYRTLLADDRRGLFAFQRRLGDEVVVVVLNNSPARRNVRVPVGPGTWEPLLGGNRPLKARACGAIRLDLEGRSGVVLVRRPGS
jgi:glycosidase